MSESKWYLRTQDETFGPETEAKLVEWARLGRVQPGQEISDDNIEWRRVEDVPFLDMRFSIDIGDGNPRGPFNRAAAEALLASGRLPPTASIVETREPFAAETPAEEPVPEPAPEPPPEPAPPELPPEPAQEPTRESVAEPVPEKSVSEPEVREVEKIVEKIVEVPVEKIVEKVVEVPVEKIVEKVVEKVVEVPVEKIVEKVVVDETRVRELEGLLAEERRHTTELQNRIDEASRTAAAASKDAAERERSLQAELASGKEQAGKYEQALKDAADRENKYEEQVKALEDELRRLPQAASEVADIQAAVYSVITGEAEGLLQTLEVEKQEFEAVRKRFQERTDRLQERRRELLKRAGTNIEDMTRKALLNRPEDPRTTLVRKELDELRRVHERTTLESEAKIRELSEALRIGKAEAARNAERAKDMKELQAEVQDLRERLQTREKDLVAERQRNDELTRQQATRQQALLARLATLESPSIGTAGSLSTNQSREAKMVKLPGWMRLKG